jgi:hypothetical protein
MGMLAPANPLPYCGFFMAFRSYSIAWLIAACASAASAAAQTRTVVRIAKSGVDTYGDKTCTASSALVPLSLTGGTTDTLIVVVQDDQNADVNSPKDLAITIGSKTAAIATTGARVTLTADKPGDFVGKALNIRRTNDNVQVCTVSILPVDAPEDPARRAFRLGIGATFDFLTGPRANELYADITMFVPDLWRVPLVPRISRAKLRGWYRAPIGLDGALFNGRTTASADTVINKRRTVFVGGATDTIWTRIVQSFDSSTTVFYEPLGNNLTPIVRLMDKLWLAFHFEGVNRTTVTKLAFRVTRADTNLNDKTFVGVNDTTSLVSALRFVPGDSTAKVRTTRYEEYFGVGPLVSFELGGIELRTKSIFGLSKVGGDWDGSYILQFRLTDRPNGFKVGGEIRKFPGSLPPTMLVYLSKDYGIQRIGSLFAGDGSK